MSNVKLPTPEGFFDKFFSKEQIPMGYMNAKQMAEAYGMTIAATASKMRRELELGNVHRVYVREFTGGKTTEVAYYGPPKREEPGH